MACRSTLSLASSPAMAASPLASASSPFVASSSAATPAAAMVTAFSSPSSLKSLSVTCGLSEKAEAASTPASSARKSNILTGLLAAGAALSVFMEPSSVPALAAIGPGGSGAERTAQKAQDLLKSADKLNVEDAPQRYGPGQVAESAQDAGKVAQDAGGKALSQLQGGVQGAAENVASQVKDKSSGAAEAGGAGGLLGSIKEGLQGLKESVASKDADAKKTLDEAASNVRQTVQ